MELIVLSLVALAALAGGLVLFRKLWPKGSTPSNDFSLGTSRAITTGQIARGVFWGLWLFTLSQILLAAIVMIVVLLITGAALSGLDGLEG